MWLNKRNVLDFLIKLGINDWLMISGIVIEFRALFLDDDPVLGLITGIGVIAVFVCNVLEYRKRMQSRHHVFQSRTDDCRMLKEGAHEHINHHCDNLLPVHNCHCTYCEIKRCCGGHAEQPGHAPLCKKRYNQGGMIEDLLEE